MKHIVIFPTWACQLECVYCSIRHSQIDRSIGSVPWSDWAVALLEVLPRGSIVDIAGGEPFMYPGLVDLLHTLGNAGLNWAITTNAKAGRPIVQLCKERPRGGLCINVSDHAGNPEAHERIRLMREAGWRVNVHRVDHPDAGHHEPDAEVITYQDWIGGKAVDGMLRHCTAGINHWVAGPNGDLWRCVVALETGQPAVGNLFTREVRPTKMECDFGCSACYTEDPGSWLIEMKVLEAVH